MTTYSILVDDGRHPMEHFDLELPDVEAAWGQATRIMGAMLEHEPGSFWETGAWQVSVQCDGLVLFELHGLMIDAPAIGRRRQTTGLDA
jgi:hypothetical protein